MTPLTRKENYLNEIVGWGNTAPEKTTTPEEFFFAAILGEAVQAPEPLTRYQMYLAKIAGRDIEIPTPITRLEYFLAKAAGMNVTTPTPITREEVYWSNYTAIVEFEIENTPPLTYKAIEGTLKNYRIYGNTVNGESVGDRTANLFDGNFLRGYWAYADGEFSYINTWICTTKISCTGGQAYTYSFSNLSRWTGFVWYDADGNYISTNNRQDDSDTQYRLYCATAPSNTTYMAINIAGYPDQSATILPSDITDFMLVAGEYTSETMPNYEPYGYKVPVTVNSGTVNIYLDEQIVKSGDDADYIDYATQKRYNADGTTVDVELPTLQTVEGTNTLSVGTEVQPSKVYIKGEKEREYT